MRKSGTRPALLTGTALTLVALGAAAMLIWTPGAAFASTGGVLGAALVGWLTQDRPRRRPAPAGPVGYAVRITDLDYVALTDGDRTVDVPAAGHTVQVVVTGLSAVPVLLTGLRAEVLERGDGRGDLSRHAAAVPVRRFEVRLDEQPPRVLTAGFPYRLAHHRTEVFDMAVHTDSGDVRWRLWLDWSAGGQTGALRIDLAGQPFRTAARHGIPG
ncbi:hypothetical protein [Actinoplanes sp. L3-i22]|uniref:hypothetical protein n=1 Tax=Actinoplanes sp. L3-i22 TaxID=2836373 RepID=UPI001C756186|nr:hypothetical protein [Actinoplanes sp. L3-i22]BCY13493.1 hypothetical protein L3i22_085810 [Actinoplanes sp. L3-i22]